MRAAQALANRTNRRNEFVERRNPCKAATRSRITLIQNAQTIKIAPMPATQQEEVK
jgi:hypothetical protein